jgi:hypothetical protein
MLLTAFWLGCGSDSGGGGGAAALPTTIVPTGTGTNDGGLLGATCSVVASEVFVADSNGSTPFLAANGGRYALTWVSSDGTAVFLAVLDGSGNRLTYRTVTTGVGLQQPTVYVDGAGYMLLWSETGAIMSQRVDELGRPVAGGAIDLANPNAAEPRVRGAVSSSGFLSAWDSAASGQIALFAGTGALVKSVMLPGSPAFPVPVSDGTTSAVFWSQGSSLAFARLNSTLTVGDVTTIPAQATNKAATVRDGRFYVAWEDVSLGDGSENVFIAEGGKSQKVTVPPASGSANWPSITPAGGFIAVAYYQFRGGPPAIYLSLFTPDLLRVGTDLRVSPEGEPARFPSIVVAGTNLGVAFAQSSGPVKFSLVSCQ